MLRRKRITATVLSLILAFEISGIEVMAQEELIAEAGVMTQGEPVAEAEIVESAKTTEKSIPSLKIAGEWVASGGELEENPTLPSGVSYDLSTNTVTLDNVNVESEEPLIDYDWGSKDLTIKLIGKNVYKGIGEDSGGIWESYYASGDIYIQGDGSLEVQNNTYIFGQSFNEDGGDLYIDGVTLISDGEGLISQYSNITIKNATVNLDCQKGPLEGAYGGYAFGICTGRTESNDEVAYGGVLTIENSEIEMKNFLLPIAANEIRITGCNVYGGNKSAEFKIAPNRVHLKSGVRYLYGDKYMKISKEDLVISDAYYIRMSSDNNGSIGIKTDEYKSVYPYFVNYTYAGGGQTVDVEVYPDKGYRLKQIYVNDKAITGTSFVMPAQDTVVRAEFEKVPVTIQKATNLTVSGLSKKIAAGKKITLTAKVSPTNASNKAVTWKSSNTKVATVNSSGVVTMKKKSGGKSVTITATAKDGSGVKATYKIKSMKGVVKKVSVSGKKTVKAGKTLKLKGKVMVTKGANKKLKWTSSNTKYAKVTSSGKVKTYKAGKGKKVKITAMATDGSGKKKSVTIKIK